MTDENPTTWAVGMITATVLVSNAAVLTALDDMGMALFLFGAGIIMWSMGRAARTDGMLRTFYSTILGVDV